MSGYGFGIADSSGVSLKPQKHRTAFDGQKPHEFKANMNAIRVESGKRNLWKDSETEILILVWEEYAQELRGKKRKRAIYEMMARRLMDFGVHRAAAEIKTKIKNLVYIYRREKELIQKEKSPPDWPFFIAIDKIQSWRQHETNLLSMDISEPEQPSPSCSFTVPCANANVDSDVEEIYSDLVSSKSSVDNLDTQEEDWKKPDFFERTIEKQTKLLQQIVSQQTRMQEEMKAVDAKITNILLTQVHLDEQNNMLQERMVIALEKVADALTSHIYDQVQLK